MQDSALSTVLKAAVGYANEIEGRSHTDATITEGARIYAAVELLRDQQAGVELDKRIHIVARDTIDEDHLYAFEDERQAHRFAGRHPGARVHEEILMIQSVAAQFLIEDADADEADDEAEPAEP